MALIFPEGSRLRGRKENFAIYRQTRIGKKSGRIHGYVTLKFRLEDTSAPGKIREFCVYFPDNIPMDIIRSCRDIIVREIEARYVRSPDDWKLISKMAVTAAKNLAREGNPGQCSEQ